MQTSPRADFEDDLEKGIDYRVLLGVSEKPTFEEVVRAARLQLEALRRDVPFLGHDLAGDQARRIERAFKSLTGENRARYLGYLRIHRQAAAEDPNYEFEQF
jgi:hypothetical protein